MPKVNSIYTPSSLEIILKVSERCNLTCSYCYFFFGGNDDWKKHPAIIPSATVDDVKAFLLRLPEAGIRDVSIILHGGEPLMLKKTKMNDLLSTLSNVDGVNVTFKMQSNGVLIDNEWVEILDEHAVSVGISIDGPEEINDIYRLDKKGKGSFSRTLAGYKLLSFAAENGANFNQPGLLTVINPSIDGRYVFDELFKIFEPDSINILEPDFNHTHDVPQSDIDGVANYILGFCEGWLALEKVKRPNFNMLQNWIGSLLEDDFMEANQYVTNELRGMIAVSSSGQIGTEDTLHSYVDNFKDIGLSIGAASWGDIVATQAWRVMNHARDHAGAKCKTCEWWKLCRGGNLVNRFSKENGFENETIYCTARQKVYTEIAAILVASGLEVPTLARRLGLNSKIVA